MKKVIVTGATGFIGLKLIEKLVCENLKVFAVIRKNSFKKELLTKYKNIEIIELDMNDYINIDKKIKESCDILYHLSWSGIRGGDRDNIQKQNLNLINSINLLKSCIKMKCKKVIIAGSQAEYGEILGSITEESICNPINNYGIKKLEFYEEALKICKENNVHLVEARFFSVYGPNDYEKSLITMSISNMLQNKECFFTECLQKWNYLYVDDAANALISLGMEKCQDGIYNVASYETKKLKEFVYMIYYTIKSKSKLNFSKNKEEGGKIVTMDPNINKITTETTWRPKTTFETGIRRIIKQFCISQENIRQLRR